MKIRFLTQYYPPEVGAPPTRISEMARLFVRAGHEVSVLTGMPNYPDGIVPEGYRGRIVMSEKRDGVAVDRTWLYAAPNRGMIPRLLNQISFAKSAFLRALALPRPDVLIVESPPIFAAAAGAMMAAWWGIPFVVNLADLWLDVAKELRLVPEGPLLSAARALEAATIRRAAKVIAVTLGIEDRLRARGVPARKIAFIPNGVDLTRFGRSASTGAPHAIMRSHKAESSAPVATGSAGGPPAHSNLRDFFGLPSDRFIAISTGNLGLILGNDTILDAAKLVAPTRPDILFLLVGNGPENDRLRARVQGERIANVEIRPGVPGADVPALLRSADRGIAALRKLPVCLGVRPVRCYEMMASGLPVIFAGEGEMVPLLSRGAGLVVPPEDPRALADAVLALAADPDRRVRMGRAGAEVVRVYDRERIAVHYLSVLEDIIRAPKPRSSREFRPS